MKTKTVALLFVGVTLMFSFPASAIWRCSDLFQLILPRPTLIVGSDRFRRLAHPLAQFSGGLQILNLAYATLFRPLLIAPLSNRQYFYRGIIATESEINEIITNGLIPRDPSKWGQHFSGSYFSDSPTWAASFALRPNAFSEDKPAPVYSVIIRTRRDNVATQRNGYPWTQRTLLPSEIEVLVLTRYGTYTQVEPTNPQ